LQDQTSEQGRSLNYLLHYHDDPALEVVASGEEKIAEADCQILSATFKGIESRLWVGPDGKIVKQAYQGLKPANPRPPAWWRIPFSDYRPEGALLICHKQVRRVDGEELLTSTIDSFEVNPKVDPSLFKKTSRVGSTSSPRVNSRLFANIVLST